MVEDEDTRGPRLELVGVAEAAELLGVSKAVLCERRRTVWVPGAALPVFPEPVARLRCGPVWLRSQIDGYQAEAERLAKLSWFERRYGDLDDPLEQALRGLGADGPGEAP
jgi:hypothetical protein